MLFVEGFDDFRIYDNLIFDNEIRSAFADEMSFVMNWEFRLLRECQTKFSKFNTESILVDFLVKPRTDFSRNRDRPPII